MKAAESKWIVALFEKHKLYNIRENEDGDDRSLILWIRRHFESQESQRAQS